MMFLLTLLMMRVLFSFHLKLNSHHLFTFTPPLLQTLKQNHRALHNCYSIKNKLKLLASKWLFNELLLEAERSEVTLILRFVSIKFIGSFSKVSLLMSLYKRFSLKFQLHWKNIYIYRNVLFPSIDIIKIALHYFYSVFFLRKVLSYSFLLPIFY